MKLKFMKAFVKHPLFYLKYATVLSGVVDIDFHSDNFLNLVETISTVVKNRKSIIRFGDGEISLLLGFDIRFQEYTPELAYYLKRILKEYNDKSPYVLGIPWRYLVMDSETLKKWKKTHFWIPFKIVFSRYFDPNTIYGDAFVFRHLARIGVNIFEKILLRIRPCPDEITIVANEYTRHTVTYLWKTTSDKYNLTKDITLNYINIPKRNAFLELHNIIDRIHEIHTHCKNPILISAGPTGKVLSYILSDRGYWVLDIGHYFDSFRVIHLETLKKYHMKSLSV
ncbi:hypothetical protein TEU_03875 [Thermococcus eurythermalis]|uniref:Glycosyltransferase GT-D fold domain-containing protein n=1 Tax=Thermococcus eurythermalis TaxID=1505907 RepID=A0A097QSS8_9EURY|nr:GT-D fold domain-containing glycosyltransferase [Thermococcus eurythermalis]AIU69548.1 hypothetical protein TEU_03875 [Thermococcus eurythermalis]